MGGAKSKFDQTDWHKANGGLSEAADTIDGQLPTLSHGIYHLTKTGVNQREFEVTDMEENVLIKTKIVPGTLCWFDVYRRDDSEQSVLRIQVGLSRRYWIVYRIGVPTFPGQLPDMEATERLAEEQKRNSHVRKATPFLFRKCCIAVSWSRYMALAMHYGAPTGAKSVYRMNSRSMTSLASLISTSNEADEDFFDNASRISSSKMRERNYDRSLNDDSYVTSNSQDSPGEEKNDEGDRQQSYLYYDHNATISPTNSGSNSSTSDTDENKKGFGSWIGKHREAFRNANRKLTFDPLEGQLDLHKPLVLCQEIYDRFIGNHQTSSLTKEQAIDLLREDMQHHVREGGEDEAGAELLNQEEIFGDLYASDSGTEPYIESNGLAGQKLSHPEEKKANGAAVCAGNDVVAEESLKINTEGESVGQVHDKEEPLIGYWKWENTLRTHKMKMHVARGSDLALHVVLAIVVNQVRYERNAVFAVSI